MKIKYLFIYLIILVMTFSCNQKKQETKKDAETKNQRPNILLLVADDMGLGKTLQTLTFIQKKGGQALVVCPSSLVSTISLWGLCW